jgi:hypothetical protein
MSGTTQSGFNHVRRLLEQNELDEALQQLEHLLPKGKWQDAVDLQKSNLKELEKNIRDGTLTYEQGAAAKTRIRRSVLQLLREAEEEMKEQAPAISWLEARLGRNWRRKIVLIALPVLLVLAYFILEPNIWKEVSGRVFETIDGQRRGVANATIKLRKPVKETTTSEEGQFTFRIPFYAAPPYYFDIIKEGYRRQLDSISADNLKNTQHEISKE